jgi:hypothetical protein
VVVLVEHIANLPVESCHWQDLTKIRLMELQMSSGSHPRGDHVNGVLK